MEEYQPKNLLSESMRQLAAPGAAQRGRGEGALQSAAAAADVPLLEATPEQLREGFAENLFALFRSMGGLPGAEVEESSGLGRHHAFPINPMFKGIWQARLTEESLDEVVQDSLAWFRKRGAPFAFWWCDARTRPATLPERLAEHGFVPWEENAPGMAAELGGLDFGLMERVPAGFAMEQVQDEAGLRDFRDAFVEGMEVPAWAGDAWVEATLAAGIDRSPWRCYVGRLHGKPVASNMLFCGAGLASVFGVATVPSARRQGIGAAITLLPYYDALEAGYRYGVLFATELGAPVYRRMGFQDVDATISRYLWRA